MQIHETPLSGAFLIEPAAFRDQRGAFIVAWEKDKLTSQGMNADFVQGNVSVNRDAGTVRGLHAQADPYAQGKLVRCNRGAIFDVIVDIRPDSATYGQWYGAELSEDNQRLLYVPTGFLHGFQTLVDHTEVYYQITAPYHPASEFGARYDDPAFNVQWPPVAERILSDKDRQWPPFQLK